MMTYQVSVSSGKPEVLTEEKWNELIDSPTVKVICNRIASLDPAAADYNDRKQALKRRLPIIMPHAAQFLHGRRVSADAIPSGFAMLDVDHVAEPRTFLERCADRVQTAALTEDRTQALKKLLIDNHIYFVAITASGQGLRIIGARGTIHSSALAGTSPVSGEELESIEAAQMRMAEALGIKEYDAVTKDLARASYVVPRDYILWMDSEELFAPANTANSSPKIGHESPVDFYGCGSERGLARSDGGVDGTDASTESTPSPQAVPSPCLRGRVEQPVSGEELNYRGVPYVEIVNQLLAATGDMNPLEGERNMVYFGLAKNMRYICDFSAEKLYRVLPDFGLSEQERRQTIASAIGRPRKDQIPVVVQSAIAVCEREQQVADVKTLPKAAEMPMPQLPKLLQLLCRRLPENYRPAMIVAALPVLGTLATKIRFEYLDKQEQSLSFFSCITAPAASGKSFIRKPVDLLLTPINEQDALEREKERVYKEKLRASKNSKFQPEDPHACPRNNGISISIAKLLQLMTYAEGKHLIGIGEEMDTLVKSEKAGAWSQKSDIYRLAFDNAEYGQAYMSDQSFNAHIPVYYNLLLTGTPNSMRRFFKDMENGLVTRVCFAQLPDTAFTEIPVFEQYTKSEKEEIIRWARQLENEHGTISCKTVNKAISDWLNRKLQEAIDADNRAMDIFRRRAAVIGFRAGMLCYLLENHRETSRIGQFAEWVAEYVFRNQMELWGEQMQLELSGAYDVQTERGAASSLLTMLPIEFTTSDLIQLRVKKGQSITSVSINTLLCRWKKTNRIEKIAEGLWKRVA